MKKLVAIIIVLLMANHACGCTGTLLKTVTGSCVYARTLEFAQDLYSQILVIPRKHTFSSPTPDNKSNGGLTWKAKYAAVGANAFDFPLFVDGVNERGLAGGFFYFPRFAQYQDVPQEQYGRSLPMWELLTWMLTSFATIDEIKKELPAIYVSKAHLPGKEDTPPAHLIMHDEHGNSLVVEYINGKLHMHENPLGVITNSPNFDWHMTNVRNYINLSPVNAPDKTIAGLTFSQLWQGSGLVGLPGDFTPPSRFIRIALFTHATPKIATEIEAVEHAFHILNNFDIPKGSVRTADGVTEYTQWTSACDMKNKIFYIKTYENFSIQKIELHKMDLNGPQPRLFSLSKKNSIHDIIS